MSHRPTQDLLWIWLPILAVLLIGLSTLGSGMRLDDYLHGTQIQGTLSGTSPSPWWDIFFLADFDPGKRFSGAMPWWTVDGLHVRFFRPIAAASHLLDHAWWPRAQWAMHAHSVALHLVFVALVALLYRRFFSAKSAAIAATVFAISINHASTVTWIANRNALLAAIFSVATLLLYQDWCAGKRRGVLAVPALLCALLSAEASICIFGFLIVLPLPSHREAAPHRRWWLLAALVLLTLSWRWVYSHYGFGAVGSGAYVDPVRSPGLFATLLPERLAVLVGMGFAPIGPLYRGDLSPLAQGSVALLCTVTAIGVGRAAVRPQHRRWLVGGLVALLPLVAATPVERLLTLAFIGFCPAIAAVIVEAVETSGWKRVLGGAAALTHLLVSPALFVLYALTFQPNPPVGLQLEGTQSRNLVLISAPSVQDVTHLLESRYVNRLPRPAFIWYLWISESPEIQRDGCCALEISDAQGHGREPYSEFFRDQQTPLRPGQVVKTLGYDVHVIDVASDGYVTRARFDFRLPLEHANLVFAEWADNDFVNVAPPAQN